MSYESERAHMENDALEAMIRMRSPVAKNTAFISHPLILVNALKACREHVSSNYDKDRDYGIICVIDEALLTYQASIKPGNGETS